MEFLGELLHDLRIGNSSVNCYTTCVLTRR